MKKFVLGLTLPTDPRWTDIAKKNIEDILVDHAYCEQKAASSCISLIVQYPDMNRLVDTLVPIVAEEWHHFERVLEELKKRGMRLTSSRKDEYVDQLQKIIKKGGARTDGLVEKLLLNALIEARSCERFQLLWKGLEDKELSQFYYELMLSEAGHYKMFLALAEEYKEKSWVRARWKELLKEEAQIIRNLEIRSDRMH